MGFTVWAIEGARQTAPDAPGGLEAEDLLGRIGDARSLEPLLRLKAVEEKA